jgi:hypothetical protein
MPDFIHLPGIGKDTIVYMAVRIGKKQDFGHAIKTSGTKIESNSKTQTAFYKFPLRIYFFFVTSSNNRKGAGPWKGSRFCQN